MKLKVWRSSLGILLLVLGVVAARAQDKLVEVAADHVGVRIELPEGFERLSAEEVAAQYARGVPPKAVFREPRRELRVTVNSFDAQEQAVPDLPAWKKRLEKDLAEAFPTAEWISRDTVKLGGVEWARMRFKGPAGIGQVVSDVYATVWAGKALLLSFYCPEAEFQTHRSVLERIAGSTRLSVSVIAPARKSPPAGRRGGRRKP